MVACCDRWREPLHGKQSQSQVARLVDQPVECGLVANGAHETRATVGVVGDRQPAELLRPALIQVSVDTHAIDGRHRLSSEAGCDTLRLAWLVYRAGNRPTEVLQPVSMGRLEEHSGNGVG